MTSKIDRALIIRRDKVELSKKYAQMCAESCKLHNLDYEFIKAVEFLPCDQAFQSVGAKKRPNYKNTMGNCCCHSSHIKCWRRIIEIGKPCLVLEHDSVVMGDVKGLNIPDMAVVTFGHRVSSLEEYSPPWPAEKLVKIPKAVGVHACALTPKTAEWLVKDAEQNGVGVGVDKWLMMQRSSGLPLYVCEPPQVVCWARKSTSNFKESDGKNINPSQKFKSQTVVYKESITSGWREGKRK